MDDQDDVGISQVKSSPVRSKRLTIVHLLVDLTAVGPLRKIGRLKCFLLYRVLLIPSGWVSRSGFVRRKNLMALVAILFTYGRKIRESFKDLKEIHKFFVIYYNL
jgi:hypothetical protein